MSSEEHQQFWEMSGEERYDYSLFAIAEEREVWILVNNDNEFLKIVADEESLEYLPIWPSSELAKACGDEAGELQPKSISLPEFLKRWLPGLAGDGLEIGVFPVPGAEVWITDSDALRKDLDEALAAP